MKKFKFLSKIKVSQLPQTSGIYAFKKKKAIIYVGKAKNIRKRVKNHADLIESADQIGYIKTADENAALILEAELIKKHQPKKNVQWRDDKNYFYVGITQEEFPRVFITHQTPRLQPQPKVKMKISFSSPKDDKTDYVGPFTDGKKLKRSLENLRKRFPFRTCKTLPKKPCLWFHLNRCPAPCLLRSQRIEAYDISNIQGQQATGSMVTFINGKPNKNFYRRFKIKMAQKPNDTAMIKEVLKRRLKHKEWGLPDLLVIDGGRAQLNAALSVTKIPVMALAKKNNELYMKGLKKPVKLDNLPREIFNLILHLRDEAHRFAKTYHLKLRQKALLG